MSAPVLPAETATCAAPCCTWATATRMVESFLRRSATSMGSSMATTSVAATHCTRGCWASGPCAAATCGGATSSSRACGCCCKKVWQAGRVTVAPASPPMTSTASVMAAAEAVEPIKRYALRTAAVPKASGYQSAFLGLTTWRPR